MDAIYWTSLVAGGCFVLLSLFGGGDTDMDVDVEADLDLDMDSDIGAAPGLVDLFSLRTLFLFAAFFGLCGVLLQLTDMGEGLRVILSLATGMFVGIGGNYIIKRVGYEHISSTVTPDDLKGRSGRVLIPFGSEDSGKIVVLSKGQRMNLVARGLEGGDEFFDVGEEVVVVRIDGRVAEVVKPF